MTRELTTLFRVELLLLVDGITALCARTEALALHGLQEDDTGLVLNLGGMMEGGVDFLVVLAAALDGAYLLVGERLHEFPQLRRVLHPVLTHRVSGRDRVHLVIPIHGLLHTCLEDAVLITIE